MLNQTRRTETLRVVRCGVADETYGLDMSWVRSIQRTDRLHHNPEAEGPSTGLRAGPSTLRQGSGRALRPGSGQARLRAGPSTEGRVSTPADVHRPVGWLPGSEGEIPVFSLASRLGRPSKESSALQRIVVLNSPSSLPGGGTEGEQPWALLVDRISQVVQIPADRAVPLPPIVVNPSADYFKGVLKLDEGLILFLSPERLHPDASLSNEPAGAGLAPAPKSPTASSGGQRRSHGRIVVFSITEPYAVERALSFGLSISQVLEVLEPLPTTPVPGAPAFVLGLVNWRDRPVPLVDLASRLGLVGPARSIANGRARLMIARDKGHVLSQSPEHDEGPVEGEPGQGALVGFLAQPAIRLLRLPIAHQPSNRPLTLDQALTRGIVELEKETLVIPDIRGILWRDSSQLDNPYKTGYH